MIYSIREAVACWSAVGGRPPQHLSCARGSPAVLLQHLGDESFGTLLEVEHVVEEGAGSLEVRLAQAELDVTCRPWPIITVSTVAFARASSASRSLRSIQSGNRSSASSISLVPRPKLPQGLSVRKFCLGSQSRVEIL